MDRGDSDPCPEGIRRMDRTRFSGGRGKGMRNHEITSDQDLLDRQGQIAEPGWSRRQFQRYRRRDVKAPAFRIKEWDYYLILSGDFGIALTMSDDGYMGLQSVSFLKFTGRPFEHTETIFNVLPMGRLKMPETSSKGNCFYRDQRLLLSYEILDRPSGGGRRRHLICHFKDFYQGKPFKCNIFLDEPDMDTMVIATPWNRRNAFYYNQKINCMRASGKVLFDGEIYRFDSRTDFGTLDWGRGAWTYENTWYWGTCSCDIEGHRFGFNIGYGFGDTRAASENILFWDGVGHKLDDVMFLIPGDNGPNPILDRGAEGSRRGGRGRDAINYMGKWRYTSSDGRFEMDFLPLLDRRAKIDRKIICSDQHQVFGKMSGTAVLDDGRKIVLKDVLCSAEHIYNRF